MAFVPTIEAAKVAIRGSLFGQTVINTLWFSGNALGDDFTLGQLTALATDVGSWFIDNILPIVSDDYSLVDVTATSQNTATSPSVSVLFSASGEIAGASLPSTNCVCVSFRTAERGRSSRGRNYVSGIPESEVIGNTVNQAYITNLEDGYNFLVNNTPTGWNWIIVSFVENGINRPFGFKQEVINALIVDRYLDTQTRRGTGRGA